MNRESAINIFKSYTDNYDSSEPKVALKIEHSFKVCEIAEEIAKSLDLPDEDVELAWFMGLLHDIGRFEQLRRYGTFFDAKSIDHAELSADILFVDDFIKNFDVTGLPKDWHSLTELAIRAHNKLNIPENLTQREELFANLLRDADKVDIFRVIAEIPYKDRANFKNVPQRNEAREEIMQCVKEHRCVPRTFERTKFETSLSHGCMAFELVYPKSKELTLAQGFLRKIIQNARLEANEKECLQLDLLEEELSKSLHEKIS